MINEHAIACEQSTQREQRSILVHHLLHGLCSSRRGSACKLLCNRETEMTVLGATISKLVLDEFLSAGISSGTFEEVCYALGFRMPASHMLSVREELLKFYNDRLENLNSALVSNDTADCLNNQETMIKSSLLILAGSHGLQCSGSIEDLRARLFTHICSGSCKTMLKDNVNSDACRNVVDQVPPVETEDFAVTLLASIVHRLSGRALRRVATMRRIEFSSLESISKLRRLVKRHIIVTAKGKHILERTTLDQAIDDRQPELNRIRARWPVKKSEDFLKSLVDQFKSETSSSVLSSSTCASCGERKLRSDMQSIPLEELELDLLKRPDYETTDSDNEGTIDEAKIPIPWLHPDTTPPRMPFDSGILDNILVNPDGVVKSSNGTPIKLSLCSSCRKELDAHRVPRLAMANRLFLGDVPEVLRDLTTIEESMISLCRAKCTIIHLKTDGTNDVEKDSSSNVMPNHQRGMRGHVIMHAQRPDVVAELLPPSIEDIVSPICVIYSGATPPTQDWLKKKAKPLAVRADKVRKALIWLKAHNYLYRHITINMAVLDEINRLGHLPFHVEHIPAQRSDNDSLTSGYTNEFPPMEMEADDKKIPFESVLITDVDGHASSNVLRAAAIRHFNRIEKGYLEMPHSAKPESEFWNPQLFPKLYPSLFPYGIGGFEDSRRVHRISLRDQTRHFLNLADRRFQTHPSFMFMVFNILQRRQVLLNTSVKMKRSSFENIASDFVGISGNDIETVTNRVARGDYTTAYTSNEKRVLRLMREVK